VERIGSARTAARATQPSPQAPERELCAVALAQRRDVEFAAVATGVAVAIELVALSEIPVKIVSSQLRQDLGVNLVLPERLLVALQPQLPQPSRDVHKRPSRGCDRVAKATRVTDRMPSIRSRPPPTILRVPFTVTAALGSGAAVRAAVCLLPVRDPKAEITNEPAIASDIFGAGRPIYSRSAGSILLVAGGGQIGHFVTSIIRRAADTQATGLPMHHVTLYQLP
jgi:hypothetical protein